jgi:hypothetical protein
LHLLETGFKAIQLSPYHADPPARRPVRLGSDRRFSGMLRSPSPFGSRVSHQIQRHLLSSLPAVRAIQHCASWRSYNTARPHQGIAQRVPDGKHDGVHLTATDLDRGRILLRPVLGGLINEYARAA